MACNGFAMGSGSDSQAKVNLKEWSDLRAGEQTNAGVHCSLSNSILVDVNFRKRDRPMPT